MKYTWWKILTILILLYVLIAGLALPLRPGILEVDKSSVQTGTAISLNAKGYNTNYTKAKQLRAWLIVEEKATAEQLKESTKPKSFAIATDKIDVIDDNNAALSFSLPANLPVAEKITYARLIMDNEIDGKSELPQAVSIKSNGTGIVSPEAWNASITDLHSLAGVQFPYRNILYESIRNLFFHVAVWMAMFILFIMSLVFSAKYLRSNNMEFDRKANAYTTVGVVFGILGLLTGMVWANYTWGKPWTNDVKLNMTAISLLIYLAYFVLRMSFDDYEKRARIAAIYNIFALSVAIPLIMVVPRMFDSLHPGNGGNPAFSGEDSENTLKMVFYPAVIGWTMLGFWMANLQFRYARIKDKVLLGD